MMSHNGPSAREKILDAAHALMLRQGFSGTSVDAIVEESGVAKGSFFYHFKSKADLARALVERYAEFERQLLATTITRAEKLSRDPLQQAMIVIGLFEEMFEALSEPHPGCLFASFCYQNDLLTDEVKEVVRHYMVEWREVFAGKLRAASKQHPPAVEVDLESLAEMFITVLEGAFVISKTTHDPTAILRHIRHYRNYLELLFSR